MGASEESTPAKSSRPTGLTQAGYGAGATPPPFFMSPISSPAPHPCLWGSQRPMLPPYGTPLPYPVLYPHERLYAYPNMPLGVALTNSEMEGKVPDGKGPTLVKRPKATAGNTGLTGGNSGESEREASGSGNHDASQSAESGSEVSSDASDENADQQASSTINERIFDQSHVDGANVKSAQNNGGDLWNASPGGATPRKSGTNTLGVSQQEVPSAMAGHEGISHDHQWILDERELKRQRRKESNRESARRSRLRKQAECEELQAKVEKLRNENHTLRDELHWLAEECEQLASQNNSIMEELTCLYGPDATSNLQGNNYELALHSVNNEYDNHGQGTSMENSYSLAGQNGNVCISNGKLDA